MKRLFCIMILCIGMSFTMNGLTKRTLEIYDMLSNLTAIYDPGFFGIQSQCNAPPNVWMFVSDLTSISEYNMKPDVDFNTRFGLYQISNGPDSYLLIHNDTTFIYKQGNSCDFNSTLTHQPSRMLNDLISHLLRIKRSDAEAMTDDMFMNILHNIYNKPLCREIILEKGPFIEYKSCYLYL